MFYADCQVYPGFESTAVAISQPGAYSCVERLCAYIWRRRGLSCVPHEGDPHLGFRSNPSTEVTGQAEIGSVSSERTAQQIVAVVLVAHSELPTILVMLSNA